MLLAGWFKQCMLRLEKSQCISRSQGSTCAVAFYLTARGLWRARSRRSPGSLRGMTNHVTGAEDHISSRQSRIYVRGPTTQDLASGRSCRVWHQEKRRSARKWSVDCFCRFLWGCGTAYSVTSFYTEPSWFRPAEAFIITIQFAPWVSQTADGCEDLWHDWL